MYEIEPRSGLILRGKGRLGLQNAITRYAVSNDATSAPITFTYTCDPAIPEFCDVVKYTIDN